MLVKAFSPFLTMFSKGFFLSVVKSLYGVYYGLNDVVVCKTLLGKKTRAITKGVEYPKVP